MSLAPTLPRRSRFLTEWLVLLAILLAFGGYIGYSQYQDYVSIEANAKERLTSQTAVIEKNLTPQLLAASKALTSIRDDVSQWGTAKDSAGRTQRQLQVLSDTQPSLRVLLIVNADGQVTAASNEKLIGVNLAHRDWFQLAARDNAPQTLYLIAPIKTLLDTYVMALARSISGPRGEFGGVVYGSLDPEFARAQLDSVLYTPDAWAAIAHGDGKLFMMAPEKKPLVGMDLATPGSLFTRHRNSGREVNVYADVVAATGESRMIAQRTIQPADLLMDKSLVVAVSRDFETIFAPWRRESIIQAGLFGIAALISVLSLLFYQRRQGTLQRLAEDHQDALRASEARLNEAQRIAQVGNWTLDLLSGELIWSDEVFRLFEIDKTRFGATYEAFLNAIHPDDRAAVNQAYTDSLTTRLPYEITHRLRMNDGRIKWVHEKCLSQFDAAGKALRSLGTVQDVTEREEALAAYRASEASKAAILNCVAATVAVVDRHGVIREVNDPWRRFALENGAEPGKPAAGSEVGANYLAACKAGNGLPADNALEARDGIQAVLDRRLAGFHLEYPCHSPNEERWFIMMVSPLGQNPDDGVVITHTDITEIRRSEARLALVREQRDTLVREVHHRIKNNLQSVAGLLQRELGRFVELDPRLKAAISQVHAVAIVHGLQGQRADEAVRLCDSARGICKTVSELSQRPVLFHIEDEQTAFRPVRIDNSEAVSVALVLNELVLNAVKHSPQDGPAPTVSLSADGSSAQVLIRNAMSRAPEFDIYTGAGLGTGLHLVRSLLPERGAHLAYELDTEDFMLTRLNLAAPVVSTTLQGERD